jgi:iron complex outermembrane receptor protein
MKFSAKSAIATAAASFIILAPTLSYTSENPEKNDLISMQLEDLMNVQITTASKKSQKIADTPAAAFVFSSDDIRRSAASSLPDLLRLIPGIHVARIDSNKWAISSRGFNEQYSNKLLVMIDGRTVYSPIYSGVFWLMQDIPVSDIEKIEVVRGPGSTMWGANAVNGVINIITKKSSSQKGTQIEAGAGTENKIVSSAGYGTELAQGITCRVSGRYTDKDAGWSSAGMNVDDSWGASAFNARLDVDRGDTRAFLMAESSDTDRSESVYSIDETAAARGMYSLTSRIANTAYYGQYVIGKLERDFSNKSEMSFQCYFDRTLINSLDTRIDTKTTDLDLQYRLPVTDRNEIMTGCGARFTNDSFITDPDAIYYRLTPEYDSYRLLSFFIQDEIEAGKDFLWVTAGTKLEENDFSGFESQPSARALIRADDSTSIWCSVSKAVRTPARAEGDAAVTMKNPAPGIPYMKILGNRSLMSEKLYAYEIGARHSINGSHFIDLALFYNDYYDIRAFDMTGILEMTVKNRMKGNTQGLEIFYEYDIMPGWMIAAGYSYIIIDMKVKGADIFGVEHMKENSDPRHKAELRSSFDITSSLRLDLWLRYVDEIKSYDIPGYVTADASLGWKITPDLEFSVSGRDLFDESHPEYQSEITQTLPTELERSFFAKVTWKH